MVTTVNKDVNIFGPIGGKDYLKLNAAKRHAALRKQVPNLFGGTLGSPIPQVLPAAGRKMATQMTGNTRQLRHLAYKSSGKAVVPASFAGDPLVKSAAEKLLSGSTSNAVRQQKSRKIAQLLRDHSGPQNAYNFDKEAAIPLVGAAVSGLGRLAPLAGRAAGFLRRGGAAAASAAGQAASRTGQAAGQAARYGRTQFNKGNATANQWYNSALRRTGRAEPYLRQSVNSLGGAMQGAWLGYGADTAASMTGHDSGGWGAMLGGGLGLTRGTRAGGLLRALGKMPGAKEWESRLGNLGWVGTGGNILEHNTGGLMNPTKPIETYHRLKQYEQDSLANEFGFEEAAQAKPWLRRLLLGLNGYPADVAGSPEASPPANPRPWFNPAGIR